MLAMHMCNKAGNLNFERFNLAGQYYAESLLLVEGRTRVKKTVAHRCKIDKF